MRSVGRGLVAAIFAIAGCSSSSTSQQGLAGTLDATFGGGGFVTWDSGRHDEARDLVVDAQGRTTITGNTESIRGDDNMIAIRFLADGSLDPTFGDNGVFQFDRRTPVLGLSLGGDDRGYAIVAGPNGRVIIGGFTENAAGDREMTVWVLDPSGALDHQFALGVGWTSIGDTTGAGSEDQAFDILTDATGSIVAAGRSDNAFNDGDLAVWRLKSDGMLDTGFNGTGFLTWTRAGQDNAYANALDHLGNILVTGKSSSGVKGTPDDMVWLTISPLGQITGQTIYNSSAAINGEPWIIGRDITVEKSGRRLITGWSADASGGLMGQTFIWRYLTDGVLDGDFGKFDGVEVYQETDHNNGRTITTDSQSRILIAGFLRIGGDANLAVWRYDDDGNPDLSFNGGVAVFDSGNGEDQGNGIAMNSTNGNVMVAGIVPSGGGDGDVAVWSYFSS